MFFVIAYDRARGCLLSLHAFPDSKLVRAASLRLELELAASSGVEVTLLEAENEEALRRTHGRYFHTLPELIEELRATLQRA